MSSSFAFRSLTLVALAAALSACGRDTDLSEQVMEAKQAAIRAEAAQKGAEAALARLKGQQPAPEAAVVEDEPSPTSTDESGQEVEASTEISESNTRT